MKKRIIGVTVGTTLNPHKIEEKIKPVKTVNGIPPDEKGNVEITAGSSSSFISMSVDEDGNLYCHTSGDGDAPVFEYDETTGNLYYVTSEV